MSITRTTSLPGYDASRQNAAYFPQPEAGTLRIQGEDRLDFIQRQSTYDMSRLEAGVAPLTVLTDAAARILDVLRVFAEGENLVALTLPGQRLGTLQYLQRRIFFMDKVTIDDLSDQTVQIDLEGPAAGQALRDLGFDDLPLENQVLSQKALDQEPIRAIGQPGLAGAGFRLLVPTARWEQFSASLDRQRVERLSIEAQLALRVEAGLPAAGHELTADYTPLETGLTGAISENKGCYTGQEVIARQVTYDKITQSLAGLKLEAQATPGERLYAEGKPVGTLTSAVESPRLGWIALAIIRRPHNKPGSHLQVSQAGNQAVVSQLPF